MPLQLNRKTSSHSRVSDSISSVHSFISRWDPHTSLSSSFLRATTNLHSYLLHLSASPSRSAHRELIRTNFLLQSAMSKLDEELSNHLISITDTHSAPDAISTVHSIVETMISTGYGEECLTTYQSIRRSAVTSQLTQLGFDMPAYQHKKLRKLKWDTLEMKIKSWIDAAPKAFQAIFPNERLLADRIFGSSAQSVRDAVFESIVGDIATKFLSFPESIAIHVGRSPEKLFRLLNMYDAISNLLPDIESTFESVPVTTVRSKAVSSLTKLSDAVQRILLELERAIHKNRVKPHITAPGGGILPLTRYMMNYLICLSDYEYSLGAIMNHRAVEYNPSSFEIYSDRYKLPVSVWIARLLLVLVQKLEREAECYRDNALSYLFLINNLQYMLKKVRTSSLKEVLGDEWVVEHMSKVRRYMDGHLRSGWAHVYAALPVKEIEAVERIREFEFAFQKVIKEREGWVVIDMAMREEIRLLVERMLVPPYHSWYQAYRGNVAVRFSPHDVKKQIAVMYEGSNDGSSSKSGSASLLRRFRYYMGQKGESSVRNQREGEEAQPGEWSLPCQVQNSELSFRYQIEDENPKIKE